MRTIIDVARDLTEITRLATELEAEAVHKANNHLMPGGLAMVALGHVANLEAWEHKHDTIERIALTRGQPLPELDDDDNWEPPLQTLCFWSEAWRRELDHELDRRATITTETAFIRWALNWAWDNEPHWNDMAQDIHNVVTRLENLLTEGQRDIHSEVTCLAEDCGTPLRRRMTGNGFEEEWWCNGCRRHLTPAEYGMAYADAARRELLGD